MCSGRAVLLQLSFVELLRRRWNGWRAGVASYCLAIMLLVLVSMPLVLEEEEAKR